MKIEVRRGIDIPMADALSRLHVKTIKEPPDFIECTKADSDIQWCVRKLKGSAEVPTNEEQRRLGLLLSKLSFDGTSLCMDGRAVVPSKIREELVRISHVHQLGRRRTKKLLQQHYWWPGHTKDIDNYIRACQTCAKNKYKRQKPGEAIDVDGRQKIVNGMNLKLFRRVDDPATTPEEEGEDSGDDSVEGDEELVIAVEEPVEVLEPPRRYPKRENRGQVPWKLRE
jgi:hypothetical protein